jgi:hypothetical protein
VREAELNDGVLELLPRHPGGGIWRAGNRRGEGALHSGEEPSRVQAE